MGVVVPRDGELALIARAMEGVTIQNQVNNARFYGHADHEELSDFVLAALRDLGLSEARLALEERSLFLMKSST